MVKHHPLLGQPHDDELEGPVAQAERDAASISTAEQPSGPPGGQFNWRSAFFVGLAAAAGVVVTIGLIQMFLVAAQTLLLIGMGLFLAIGLEPAVSWLINHRFPRWAAVISVFLVMVAIVGAFVAAAVPAMVDQGGKLIQEFRYMCNNSMTRIRWLGQLNEKDPPEDNVEQFLNASGFRFGLRASSLSGETVLSTFSASIVVLVLTAYFLADMPRVRTTLYRFFPAERRPRAVLLGDQILVKVGGYVLGNVIISVISAVVTYVWLLIFGVPYALLLAILFALLDLIPVIGSLVAGVLVALAAFSVSVPVGHRHHRVLRRLQIPRGLCSVVACQVDGTTWARADSSGRRNGAGGWWSVGALEELTHQVCWSLPAECLSRPVVDFCGNFSEPFGAVNGKVCAFREVLPEQPVHILVGAPFPG